MPDSIFDALASTAQSLRVAAELFVFSGFIFCSIALLVKGDEAVAAGRRALGQLRLNTQFYVFDAVLVGPLMGLLVHVIRGTVESHGWQVASGEDWDTVGAPLTGFAAVFLGDFSSYWRHRLEHTRLLWPSHAIHHSDPDMSWLTLARFHPINRLTTSVCDITFLAVLGLPSWALIVNELVRHYYGEFIHADLPWTYGSRVSRLLVSPVMHQWHHIRDVDGSGYNFATVFSVFDQAFGTYHMPGRCTVPLGVNDDIGDGLVDQLSYPFVSWAEALGWRQHHASSEVTRAQERATRDQ